jgi:hypothetical protein
MRRMAERVGGLVGLAALLALAIGAGSGGSYALDEIAGEKEKAKACEKSVCEMIVKKEATGADLSCALSRTWAKDKIKEGVEKKKISWGFGDAQCVLDLAVPRATIHSAVTKPEHSLEFPAHTIKCKVEREKEVTPINVTLAPKVNFKDGKAVKAWLGVKEIEAPAVVKGAIWTVAQVEDTVGLFHSDIISEINEFVEKKCPKALAGG